ncbi:unnamed protein product [Linum tenue]|uniref:Uncharacterized protein n=1 Tax=Linum tenue TaxID=586396 RepID=A0AAV0P7Z7_9ROSI|nr:unnamed protein product [Linum tenue]
MVIDVLSCLIRNLMNEQKRAMGGRYVNGVLSRPTICNQSLAGHH